MPEQKFNLNPDTGAADRLAEEALERLIADLRKLENAPLLWEGDQA